jgi:methyl-accepting chemotaxis protein
MRRPERSFSIFRLYFPAIFLLFLSSGVLFLAAGLHAQTYALVSLGLGLVLLAVAWARLERGIIRPQSTLYASQERIKDGLDGLSSSLAKLSTGNLATRIAADSLASIPVNGDPGSMARLAFSIAELLRESIDAFNGITNEPCMRLCYVGSDSYAEGQAVGEALGRLLGGRGSVAIFVADLHSVNHSLRRKGAMSVLAEKFPGIEVVETFESFELGDKTYAAATDIMKRHKDLRAIYATEGTTGQFAAKAVVSSGKEGKVFVVTHDTADATMELVTKGVIAMTLSQDPFAQGHDSVVRIFNHLATGWKPVAPRFLTTLQEIRKDNYQAYWSREGGAGDRGRLAAIASVDDARRASLGGRKIAIVCMSAEGFWKPVYEGALEAKRELEAYGATVEWIVPSSAEQGGITAASAYAPIIERLIAEKWDGVTIPVFDRDMIGVINKAVRAGLVVVTYNSEPLSLREMVTGVSTHASSLLALSQELAASAEESGQSTASIATTIDKIASSLRSQASETARTKEEILVLSGNIKRVNETAGDSSKTARLVAQASMKSSAAIGEMQKSVKSMEEAASVSEATIRSLKDDTDKIGTIVASIEDIANQTNVLAINASIQAARAGERGKGFAVIASEIRKLAEQSNQSAGEINRVIAELRKRVGAAEAATTRGLAEAKENSENAELSRKSLNEISLLAGENEKGMDVIFGAVEEMLSFSRRIEETVRSLTAMNERSDEAAAEIGTSTKEVSAQASEVANSARSLAEVAKAQQILLSQFRFADDE